MAISADLGDRLEDVVTRLVSTGRYNSKSEVLREGVRLVEEREKRLALLDAALAKGIGDADVGRVKPAQWKRKPQLCAKKIWILKTKRWCASTKSAPPF